MRSAASLPSRLKQIGGNGLLSVVERGEIERMVREETLDGVEDHSDGEVDFCAGPGNEGADCEVEGGDVDGEDESDNNG